MAERPRSRPVEHLRPVPSAGAGVPSIPSVDASIAGAVAGDPDAWGRVYTAYHRDIFRQLRYLTGDREQAEELTQETFAQAMVSRERYDAARPFGGWLHGIALNVARKRWRKQRGGLQATEKLRRLTQITVRPADDLQQHLVDRQRSEALYAALAELPEAWRETFILKELQEMTAAEVAVILGTTEGNVAVRVTRARARIREIFAREGLLAGEVGDGE